MNGFILREGGAAPYLSIPSFEETGVAAAGFSTRRGGVSTAPLDSLNLGPGRGDTDAALDENYRRFFAAVTDLYSSEMPPGEISPCRAAALIQVHGNTVVNAGKPMFCGWRSKSIRADGLVTNLPLPMLTYHADCAPVYILDPALRAAALLHSGWRGTAADITAAGIEMMKSVFGSRPSELLAAVGPAIGRCCFEVGEDVAAAFRRQFGVYAPVEFLREDETGRKYTADLEGAVILSLMRSGIRERNISAAGMCTCCNRDLFFSHRRDGNARGTMAALMCLRK